VNASTPIPNSPFLMSAPKADLLGGQGGGRTFVELRRTLSYASSPRVTCCDDKNRSIPTAPRGVNAHGGLFSSVFLERARGLRRRRVHVRRSHGHVLDRALQQLGHRSIPHPKNLGRVRLQSQDLRVHAKDVQRRSTSVVGLVAGSSSEGLGHAAGQLQCPITKSTVAYEIGLRTSAGRGRGFDQAARSRCCWQTRLGRRPERRVARHRGKICSQRQDL
jgi:hypothetical protein